MENQNEKKPTMSAGEGKKKRYYKKRKPKAVVANDDVVKAEQGSSSSSPAASDTPTAKPRKPRGKRAYGHEENDQLGLPKIVTTVNGRSVQSIKTREAIENAMRISSEMVKAKYAEKGQKDYTKEGSAWDENILIQEEGKGYVRDNGAHSYTEAGSCGYSDCGCNEACGDGDYADKSLHGISEVDWDMLLEKLESMNAAIGARKATFWDRVKAFGSGLLAYEKTFLLWLITMLEIRLGNEYWAIGFGCLGLTYFILTSTEIVRSMRYAAYVKELIREGAEAYRK
jgi:hypothetical protein